MGKRASTWRCDHPRTPENTCRVGAKLPGGRCRECLRLSNARYSRTEKFKATQARYRASEKGRARDARYFSSEAWRAAHARAHWRYWGIIDLTWERFQSAVEVQGGVCAICHLPPRRSRLDADHDHQTGKFRGALCTSCNVSVARYEEGRLRKSKFVRRIKNYLAQHAEVAA